MDDQHDTARQDSWTSCQEDMRDNVELYAELKTWLPTGLLKNDLQAEYGEKYINASADRAICPDLQFCYRRGQATTAMTPGKERSQTRGVPCL
ncbi:hypothetical protein AAFF_G00118080 [Aldrovandia affinis]|uniref:Uncharacterized protein n=1 Tax=Aldrovandia affinis TaxID=143900 RepID=A0AAD7RV59_9TELE|nr:hypothetical protein AAFF_G00118080 [Aldrovandia affinis]